MFGLFGGKERLGGDGKNRTSSGAEVHLALYKYDSCPFCRLVYRTIDDLGLELEYRDIRQDRAHRDALYELTGRTTVPCLVVDGKPMFESADIASWMRSTFDSGATP